MVNKVILIGNLGKDPELKTTDGGGKVVNFSIATSESYTDKSGKKIDKTEWHNIVAWGVTAENIAKYLSKGSKVYVEGKLQTRSWDDKDGVKKYTTEIVATQVTFLDGKKSDGSGSNAGTGANASTAPTASSKVAETASAGNVDESDDLPF